MKLSEYGRSLALDAAFWQQGLKDPGYPMNELGKLSLDLSTKFRALAIIALLARADTDSFYHHLIRSGLARETYLRRANLLGIGDDHHQGSGRYEPLLDALAAGDLALIRRIIDLSPSQWLRGHEYEDDYCYAQLIHALVTGRSATPETATVIERFQAVLEGNPSARYQLSRALIEQNQAAFDDSFEALLDHRADQILADKAKGQLEEPQVVAQRQVFVEGLALLRLAALRGLSTQLEYRFCPSIARLPMVKPFPTE